MLQSFFTGLSGMFSFSRNLDNVSNNVANMNTPGFRGTDTFLRSVNGDSGQGYGTNVEGSSARTTSGEIRQTGNETDLAINGDGFFILQNNNGDMFYTRAGQFRFNEDNELIDSASEMHVLGISEAGNLENIDISESRIRPPEATTQINFTGNLMTSDTAPLSRDVTIFDNEGNTQVVTVVVTNNSGTTPNSWTVQLQDANGIDIGNGEVRFNAVDNTPLAEFNSFTETLTFGGQSLDVTFNFGEPGSISGTVNFSGGNSDISASIEDGHPVLGISSLSFDTDGILQFTYSNGETEEGQRIALASFSDETKLQLSSGSLYQSSESMPPELGQADSAGRGKIQSGSIELSNVDLTQEFADILIVQRGYQASSQIMSVANELIEQLYNSTRR